MTAGDWISAVADVVQTAAILVGAAWAYFKFVRGRIFARRTELTVSGELLTDGAARAMRARVALRNTGASDIPLRIAGVWVYAADTSSGRAGEPAWTEVAKAKVLTKHQAIEAQESIAEEVLVALPQAQPPAYRVELRVYDQKKRGGATQWSSQSIVPGALRPAET